MDKKLSKVETVVAALKEVADNLQVHPSEVTKAQLFKNNGQYKVTDWTLKQIPGGLGAVKKAHLPVTTKELVVARELKDTNKYIAQLEKRIAEREFADKILLDAVVSRVEAVKLQPYKKSKAKKGNLHRELVVMLNDTHIGVIVDPEEIGGINEFDFKQAGRRIAFVIKEAIDYKPHVRNEVEKVHLILNGDIISGIIHGLATKGIHLLIHQINGAVHILSHAIQALASEFPEVQVHGIAGNHGRVIHKEGGKRAVSEVYDSYANVIYYAMSAAFRNSKRVSFNFPKTPYGFVDLPGGRAMYVHGDHIFSSALGNPGRKIDVENLSDAIHRFNTGEVAKGNKPVNLVLFGHVHTFSHFITSDGVEVYIAPSLSGLDSYAHMLTINTNFVAQVIFESTPDFILGDSRLIRVKHADDDDSLDKIIPVYNKELKFNNG